MYSGPWDRRSQRRRPPRWWRGLTGGDATKRRPGAATTSATWLAPDLTATVKLMRCSSKAVDELTTERAVWRCRAAPDPGMGASIELTGGNARGERDLSAVGETLTGIGRPAQEAPPALDQVQPGGADRNEDLMDPRVGREPVADGSAGVAGEIVRNQIQVAVRVVALKGAQQFQIARGVACGSWLGEDLPVAHAQRPIDPRLVVATAVDERRLDPVAIR